MRPDLDLTDVAVVAPLDMAVPMNHLIAAGRGLALLDGLSVAEMRGVDAAVWTAFACAPAERAAVLVRFRSLLEVFASQRLKQLFLRTGFTMLTPALHVAATMRLNAERGFNPLKFERALRETMARMQVAGRNPSPDHDTRLAA